METGIGIIKSVFPALKVLPLTPKKFAWQSVINARPIILMDYVILASRDMIWSMEAVFSLPPTMPSHQISAAVTGTGITINVLLALKVSFLTPIKFVLLFLTNARLLIQLVLAHLASKAMISSTVLVLSLLSITLKLLKLDAIDGTGITKSVSNALNVGSSTTTNSVYQSMTSVLHGIHHPDSALHASAVISFKMVNVPWLILFANLQMLQVNV